MTTCHHLPQVKALIAHSPEVLTEGSLVTAGNAIRHLKHLGFEDSDIIHRVVAYCPRVLAMPLHDVDTLVRLWAKFDTGVDNRDG